MMFRHRCLDTFLDGMFDGFEMFLGLIFDGFVVFLSEYLKIFREIYWSDLRRRAMIRATKEISIDR